MTRSNPFARPTLPEQEHRDTRSGETMQTVFDPVQVAEDRRQARNGVYRAIFGECPPADCWDAAKWWGRL